MIIEKKILQKVKLFSEKENTKKKSSKKVKEIQNCKKCFDKLIKINKEDSEIFIRAFILLIEFSLISKKELNIFFQEKCFLCKKIFETNIKFLEHLNFLKNCKKNIIILNHYKKNKDVIYIFQNLDKEIFLKKIKFKKIKNFIIDKEDINKNLKYQRYLFLLMILKKKKILKNTNEIFFENINFPLFVLSKKEILKIIKKFCKDFKIDKYDYNNFKNLFLDFFFENSKNQNNNEIDFKNNNLDKNENFAFFIFENLENIIGTMNSFNISLHIKENINNEFYKKQFNEIFLNRLDFFKTKKFINSFFYISHNYFELFSNLKKYFFLEIKKRTIQKNSISKFDDESFLKKCKENIYENNFIENLFFEKFELSEELKNIYFIDIENIEKFLKKKTFIFLIKAYFIYMFNILKLKKREFHISKKNKKFPINFISLLEEQYCF